VAQKGTFLLYRIAGILALALAACGSTAPITVKPTLTDHDYAVVSCPRTGARFYVEPAEDKRGNPDLQNVGFTQTGMFNVKASLLAQPAPAEMLRATLSGLLARCGNLAPAAEEAKFLLQPSLLALQVTEVTRFFSEEITASLKYDAVVVNKQSMARLGRATVASGAAVSSGVDTTDYATQVVQEALRASLGDFARELERYQ
jgi:hypothetical protein